MATFGRDTTGDEVFKHFEAQAEGKTVVITGTSAGGLGAEVAITLAKARSVELFLLGRSEKKIQPVIDAIRKLNSAAKVHFVSVELDKISSVHSAAQQINRMARKVDILINNAGILAPAYSKTKSGIEYALATNHVGHFVLTKLLMERIKAAGKGARIVNISSDGYKISPFRFDDFNFSDGDTYDVLSSYGQSKTANILFTQYLAKALRKDGIFSFAVNPGPVGGTGFSESLDMSVFNDLAEISIKNTGETFDMGPFRSKQAGISSALLASLDPNLEPASGAYISDCQIEALRAYASSENNAERLWHITEVLTGDKFPL